MGDTFIQATIGCIVTGVFALLVYLLKRIIDENDAFQKETKESLRVLGTRAKQTQGSIDNIKKEIKKSGLDQETKDQIKTLTSEISKVERSLVKIKPKLDNVNRNTNLIKSQDDKLRGLYEAMQHVIERFRDLQSKKEK